jgi:hypothetical protein
VPAWTVKCHLMAVRDIIIGILVLALFLLAWAYTAKPDPKPIANRDDLIRAMDLLERDRESVRHKMEALTRVQESEQTRELDASLSNLDLSIELIIQGVEDALGIQPGTRVGDGYVAQRRSDFQMQTRFSKL